MTRVHEGSELPADAWPSEKLSAAAIVSLARGAAVLCSANANELAVAMAFAARSVAFACFRASFVGDASLRLAEPAAAVGSSTFHRKPSSFFPPS